MSNTMDKKDIKIPVRDDSGFVEKDIEIKYLEDPSSDKYELIGKAGGPSVEYGVYLAMKHNEGFLNDVYGYSFKHRWESKDKEKGAEEVLLEEGAEVRVCFYKKVS